MGAYYHGETISQRQAGPYKCSMIRVASTALYKLLRIMRLQRTAPDAMATDVIASHSER